MPRETRYEMNWFRLVMTEPTPPLTKREDEYVYLRYFGSSGEEARRRMGISSRYLWDLKRQIARKYPEFLKPGNRGV